MNESILLKASVIVSLVGIILLWLISTTIEPNSNELRENNYVKIKGKIQSLQESDKTFFLKVKEESKVFDVVVFKNGILELSKGQEIEVSGTVTKYNGNYEIMAEKIKVFE
jgi:aspartyl/asparaginyl-tRNA synthetase